MIEQSMTVLLKGGLRTEEREKGGKGKIGPNGEGNETEHKDVNGGRKVYGEEGTKGFDGRSVKGRGAVGRGGHGGTVNRIRYIELKGVFFKEEQEH